MIPDCDGRSDGRTESIIAKTALCIASYADALSIIRCYSTQSLFAVLNCYIQVSDVLSALSIVQAFLLSPEAEYPNPKQLNQYGRLLSKNIILKYFFLCNSKCNNNRCSNYRKLHD